MARGQITIVGMDRTGAALALAIKSVLTDAFIVGADADANRLRDAIRASKVDRTDSNVAAACREASLIILNAPLAQLREGFEVIGPQLREGAVLLTLVPAAVEAAQWAAELLPPAVAYLLCHLVLHPSDIEYTEPHADLFHGSVLCMLPTAETAERAIKAGSDLARVIGARPYFMDALEHDSLLAAVEGVPGLVSAAVLLAAVGTQTWSDFSPVAGAIFYQATQPVLHSSLEAGQALVANRIEVLRRLDVFLERLREVRQLVDEGDAEQLTQLIAAAAQRRDEWLATKPQKPWSDEETLAGPPRELPRFDPILPGWGLKKR